MLVLSRTAAALALSHLCLPLDGCSRVFSLCDVIVLFSLSRLFLVVPSPPSLPGCSVRGGEGVGVAFCVKWRVCVTTPVGWSTHAPCTKRVKRLPTAQLLENAFWSASFPFSPFCVRWARDRSSDALVCGQIVVRLMTIMDRPLGSFFFSLCCCLPSVAVCVSAEGPAVSFSSPSLPFSPRLQLSCVLPSQASSILLFFFLSFSSCPFSRLLPRPRMPLKALTDVPLRHVPDA